MKKTLIFFVLMCSLSAQLSSQDNPFIYAEYPDDPYIHVPRSQRTTSRAYRLDGAGFSIRQVNVDENGQNIIGDAANEPSLVIDPVNPQRMAIGWRQFETISSNFRQAGFAFSLNSGESWVFPGAIEPGIFRSDPVLDTDTEGNFFYNSLSSGTGEFLCHVFKSETGSDTWDSGVFAFGGDKQWMAIDRTEGAGNGNIYAFWKIGISSCNEGAFTRSLNNGASFDNCEFLAGDPNRGNLTVGPGGELYACGGTNATVQVLKSNNPGVEGQPIYWDFVQTVDMGGTMALYDGPNPTGMLGQAWIETDHSGTASHGNVYLLATIENNEDPANVVFVRSTDGGQSWSAPLILNDDNANGNWQWFGSLSVAPNGRIDVTWLDTRDNPGTYLSRLYYSYSTDGGLSWSEDEALSDAFDPHLGWPQQQKIGDYYHQRSDSAGVHLAWSATFNGEQDVYYSYITPEEVTPITEVNTSGVRVHCVPNPFAQHTVFQISLTEPADVSIDLADACGRRVGELAADGMQAGENTLAWENPHLAPGVYYYRVRLGAMLVETGKVVKSR